MSVSGAAAVPRPRHPLVSGRLLSWTGYAALATAGLAYIAVLVLRVPALLHQTVPSSDTISPVLLVQALTLPRHGTIYLGSHPAYYDLVLAAPGLPLHVLRAVPEALPYATYLLGVVLLAAAVRRLAGWPGALLALAAAVGSAAVILVQEMSPAGRVPTLANVCLLGLVLVALVFPARGERRRWSRLLPGTILLGALTGFDTASDPLLGIVGLLPFVGTALALWATGRREPGSLAALGVAAGVGAVSVGGYLLTDRIARAVFHFSHSPPPVHLASVAIVNHNLQLLGGDVRVAFGGTWSYASDSLVGPHEAVIGGLVCLLSVAVVVVAARMVARSRGQGNRERARAGWALFWGLVMLTDVSVYLSTDVPTTLWTVRYLTPAWLALAALLPLIATRSLGLRMTTWLATAALVGVNAWSLAALVPSPPQPQTSVLQTLERHGISQGYADYWEANIITWKTMGRIKLRQVVECGSDHAHLCPYPVNSVAAWYQPRPGPVAVVVAPQSAVSVRPSATYGPPDHVIHVGVVAIYVYDHNLILDPS